MTNKCIKCGKLPIAEKQHRDIKKIRWVCVCGHHAPFNHATQGYKDRHNAEKAWNLANQQWMKRIRNNSCI